ncbi:MAG: SCO family protein [Candidatus Binatia bacterium]
MSPAAPALLLLLWLAAPARAADPPPVDTGYTYMVGPFTPEFQPPPPGSYRLPPIDRVDDHPLRDSTGAPVRLAALKQDRLAVVAFVYTTCSEAAGCPLAEAILHRLDRQLADDPALASQVRLVTISFDPQRDTPERLATVRAGFAPRTDWAFLTGADEAEITPVLEDFGQPVAKLRYEDGTWTGTYRHVLKVFLLDEQNRVRNIYSTGLMSPALVMADLRTLALERAAALTPAPSR